jgi:hypothetical protein
VASLFCSELAPVELVSPTRGAACISEEEAMADGDTESQNCE